MPSIETAIEELKAGRMIVVVDDEDRENEGDLTMAAELVTPEAINFMATHGRGLICLAMTGERLDELELASMAPDNTALGGTAFTVSIDLKGRGSHNRHLGSRSGANDSGRRRSAQLSGRLRQAGTRVSASRPRWRRPGTAWSDGGGRRSGASAGLYPAGVICEIVNDDGTMSRLPDLIRFCRKHNLVMVTVADLARYRLETDDDESLALMGALLCA